MMFCAAPTKTASMSGVVPSAATSGETEPPKRMSEKKMEPVMKRSEGVTSAAKPQPKTLKMRRPSSIMKSVTAPVHEENVPMNSE